MTTLPVRPFRALRYDPNRYPDLGTVLAPPYDVISPAEQGALHARDARNVVHLEYGRTWPSDTETDNRYTRARAALEAWRQDGTLLQDEEPAYYLHEQRFTSGGEVHTRRGVFGATELTPFGAGPVLPHEWTHAGPKVDRAALMRTCGASFSPVFALYDEAAAGLGRVLDAVAAGAPTAVADSNGFAERMWRIGDAGTTARIAAGFAKTKLLIADGHHRYETALALRDDLRAERPEAGALASFNYGLMLLVALDDPGLLVLPTHRLLVLTPEMEEGIRRIAAAWPGAERWTGPVGMDALQAPKGEYAFVVYTREGAWRLPTSARTAEGNLLANTQVLERELIAPVLAIAGESSGGVPAEVRQQYTHTVETALALVDSGAAQAAVLLDGIPVADVMRLAQEGVRLPQKSTYFYPKVPTGLVMHSLAVGCEVG